MATLISKIFDDYAGQPILVVGGGPSVSVDLPRLVADGFEPACVIGANHHSPQQSFYPTDFLVNVDRIHIEKKMDMRDLLRPFGLPIINRHSWADYRLADWTFTGNSGLTAIAVAAALGGNPIVTTGIDMWRDGRYYFHIPLPQQRRMKTAREMANKSTVSARGLKQMEPLAAFARGANIRPVSGPLTQVFKRYEFGTENFQPAKACKYRTHHRGETVYITQALSRATINITERVKEGQEVPFSASEWKQDHIKKNFALVRVE